MSPSSPTGIYSRSGVSFFCTLGLHCSVYLQIVFFSFASLSVLNTAIGLA